MALDACNGDENAVNEFMPDILSTSKLYGEFPLLKKSMKTEHKSEDDTILKSLAKDYSSCKNQEANKVTNKRWPKPKTNVLIGNTLKEWNPPRCIWHAKLHSKS